MRFIEECKILEHDVPAPGHGRIRFKAPQIAAHAKPGQFVMVQVAEGLYPFLRRPFCIEQIHDDGLNILYKVEGEGTAILTQLQVGQTCSVQGPLGNGFPVKANAKRHILIAGGIGVACLPALAKNLIDNHNATPEVVIAARTKDMVLCEDILAEYGCNVHIATDDGTAGDKAYAAQMLSHLHPTSDDCVYACGPMIMMSTTQKVATDAGATCYVSLEAQMACGDGACLGCVVESKTEHDGEAMVRVCVDGPVFDANIIDWEAHNMAYDR